MLFKDYVNTKEYEEVAARVKQAAIELDNATKHIVETCSDIDEEDIFVSQEGNIELIQW
jgi:hypothetical protein